MNPGFIGLGQLGARLASVALKAEQSIVVFDLDSSRVSGLSRQGAVAATSVVDLGAGYPEWIIEHRVYH